jgi:hypothetical protein
VEEVRRSPSGTTQITSSTVGALNVVVGKRNDSKSQPLIRRLRSDRPTGNILTTLKNERKVDS